MSSSSSKKERKSFSTRMPGDVLGKLRKAARIADVSLNRFIVKSSLAKAEAIIAEHDKPSASTPEIKSISIL